MTVTIREKKKLQNERLKFTQRQKTGRESMNCKVIGRNKYLNQFGGNGNNQRNEERS